MHDFKLTIKMEAAEVDLEDVIRQAGKNGF